MTVIRVDPRSDEGVLLMATNGVVDLSAVSGDIPGSQFIQTPTFLRLDEIWCGVTGANRVYCRPSVAMQVSVSHD
jgi:hypothetical protein